MPRGASQAPGNGGVPEGRAGVGSYQAHHENTKERNAVLGRGEASQTGAAFSLTSRVSRAFSSQLGFASMRVSAFSRETRETSESTAPIRSRHPNREERFVLSCSRDSTRCICG